MIVIIDNYDSFTFNLYQSVAELYPNVRVVRNDKISVAEVIQLNPIAIIISPGPGQPQNAGISVALVKKFGFSIPILGVCLGHQIIAQAFGADIITAPKFLHGKACFVFHHRQGLYAKMPLPFRAGRYHSLIVSPNNFPQNLMIEAESEDGLIMGLRHRHLPVFGVQFHPESILTPQGIQLIRNFLKLAEQLEQAPLKEVVNA